MSKRTIIQGEVTGTNEILYQGSRIRCWTNAMQAAIAPQPLDLSEYLGLVVEVSGILHGELWLARLEGVIGEERETKITGEVVGSNVMRGADGDVYCYRHGMVEAIYLPLNLLEYSGKTITVAGMLHGNALYRARIVEVPVIEPVGNPAKEGKSLKDLLLIRAANRAKIEAVNGNLGTALGFKWTNGQQTEHPCIIIFVPQKLNPELVPSSEKAPERLEDPDGTWCLTDVVTGGKKQSLEDIDPLPPLSLANQVTVDELKSGRIGLIGGIQLAFYGDGIPIPQNSFVGTAGIAVRQTATGKVGFLTNQHVGDSLGRRMFHPWHENFTLGFTRSMKEFAADEEWYGGIIDESLSDVRCDCAFVQVLDQLQPLLRSGLHIIGDTGSLLRVDINTMDIIGQRVISIGRTRGVQRGTIVAYAYEFEDDFFSTYTDFLIIGQEDGAFSWKGDSGKVIVTDDAEHRPVALLWGGWQERLRHGREQEMWSYAIDLGKVLDHLNLELLT